MGYAPIVSSPFVPSSVSDTFASPHVYRSPQQQQQPTSAQGFTPLASPFQSGVRRRVARDFA